MKFTFLNITLLSSFLFLNWVSLYGVPNSPEPFRQLSFLYSMLHNQQPKSACPNTICQVMEIPFVQSVRNDLLTFSPKHSNLLREDIRHAYEHGLCSLLPSKYEHSPNRISELEHLDIEVGYRLSKLNNDIWSPIQYGNSNWLLNVNSFDNLTHNKSITFIETKVTAMKLQGFNL